MGSDQGSGRYPMGAGNPPRREMVPCPWAVLHCPAVLMGKALFVVSRISGPALLAAHQDPECSLQSCPWPHRHHCQGLGQGCIVLLHQVRGGPGGPFLLPILVPLGDIRTRKITLLSLTLMTTGEYISFLHSLIMPWFYYSSTSSCSSVPHSESQLSCMWDSQRFLSPLLS